MQKASEMTIEQIETVLQGMNWTEIEKARVFNDYGDKVVLYTDGEFWVQGQSTYYRDPDEAGVIGYLPCWGAGNIDRSIYLDGFAERNEEGDYVEIETGRIMGQDDALAEAIEQGDIAYYEYIDEVLYTVRQERRESVYHD